MSLLTGAPRLEALHRPPRLTGLDAARGLAVVSMFVAHFGPNGGVWALSERLTAMLFAMIIGASLMLTAKRLRALGFSGYLISAAWRCFLLVVIGHLLQRAYDQIDVVLQTLGVLTLVLAPIVWLLRERVIAALTLAAVSAVCAPLIQQWALNNLSYHPGAPLLLRAEQILFFGTNYRVVTFLAPAFVGVALVSWWTNRQRSTAGLFLLMAWSLVVAATGFVIGKRFLGGAMVYSGTIGEIISGVALASAALTACWLAPRLLGDSARVLEPLVATGHLTLTVYAVQIFAAWAWVRWVSHDRDDSNVFLTLLTLGTLAGCWLWERHIGRGPLESLLRVPRYVLKARWSRA